MSCSSSGLVIVPEARYYSMSVVHVMNFSVGSLIEKVCVLICQPRMILTSEGWPSPLSL
jgi:hypothetical protein